MSKLSSRGTAWNKKRGRVLERDNHTCAYCNREATTVDHIVPKAAGGTDDESNLIACCHDCNATKGARTLVRTDYYNMRWFPNGTN